LKIKSDIIATSPFRSGQDRRKIAFASFILPHTLTFRYGKRKIVTTQVQSSEKEDNAHEIMHFSFFWSLAEIADIYFFWFIYYSYLKSKGGKVK